MSTTFSTISARTVRQWLNDTDEIALLDVREAGQFGEGHLFFAVNTPYSQLELWVTQLVPRKATRTVLLDVGDGVAERAARRLYALGYSHVYVLEGGVPGWQAAGYTVFQGVNLPSKTFGELVEQAFGTPHISAHELATWQRQNKPFVLLDGRTSAEHCKMSIPGSVGVPNGELPRHLHALACDSAIPVVIHCAGRTRSIIGAEILRNLGLPNPVFALENGTQGWALAGLPLAHGDRQQRLCSMQPHASEREAAVCLAQSVGVPQLTPAQAQQWVDDTARTTYVIDVRSVEEFAARTLPGATHAPGGQLLQATDQTIGTRKARVILLDDDGVRAPVIAAWLHRLGWQTATVEGGIDAPLRLLAPTNIVHELPRIDIQALPAWSLARSPQLIDLQSSADWQQQHAVGAVWSIRPHLGQIRLSTSRPVLLLVPDAATAQLAAIDLREAGHCDLAWAQAQDWRDAGLPVECNTKLPDDERIDYLFFVHDRHDGNLDAARQYLAWETGLVAQAAPDELAVFRLPPKTA